MEKIKSKNNAAVEGAPNGGRNEDLREVLQEIKNNSRFRVEKNGEEKCLIAESGEKFLLNKVENKDKRSNIRSAKEIRAFLGKFFEPEENDPEIDYVRGIERGLSDFFLIKNDKGEIVALMNSQIAGVEGKGGRAGSELIIWYVVTDPAYRGRGMATELYSAAYESAFNKVEEEDSKLLAVVGETDPDVEGYLNKMGRKRMYYEDREGNFVEVPYRAAPGDADDEPPEEHFMARFMDDRRQCSTGELLRMIKGIYDQYKKPDYFESDTVGFTKKYMALVDRTYNELESELKEAKGGVVYLLDAKERELRKADLRKRKKKFFEMAD